MDTTPIVLVPGYWLGAWAWDEVAAPLRAAGHEVTALTLPGLASPDDDRASVTFADHVDAIAAAVEAAGRPVVLAVHSGSGTPGYAVTDRLPEQIAAMVYVDTGPGVGPPTPDVTAEDLPLPSAEDLAENENLDGLTVEHLATFRARALPEPGGVVKGGVALTNDARLDVPSIMLCTSYTADEYRDAAEQGYDFVKGLADLRKVTYLELPTSHWPMWSRPQELAAILGDISSTAAGGASA